MTSDITQILDQLADGKATFDELLPAVYDELRRLANQLMKGERPDHTLDGTALVHEAFFRLGSDQSFESRRHFFGAAAKAMRRILIDQARARQADKRGGGHVRAEITIDHLSREAANLDRLEALNEALTRFAEVEPAKSELVHLRYFTGLRIHEAAEILGISTATADRHWAFARAWLQTELADND